MRRTVWAMVLLALSGMVLAGCGNVSLGGGAGTTTNSQVTLTANPPVVFLPVTSQEFMPGIDLRWSYPSEYEYVGSNFRMDHDDCTGVVTVSPPFSASTAPPYYDYYFTVRSPSGELLTATARVTFRQP